MAEPRLLILNGPTGAGKSTATRLLLERHGHNGSFAILERDLFEDLAGRLQADPGGDVVPRVWRAALPVLVAATKAYLRNGISVVMTMPHVEKDRARIARMFGKWDPVHVCILPSWNANKNRRTKRIAENGPGELEMFGWDGHKGFYDELVEMVDRGAFDAVIDSTRSKPHRVADELAALLASTPNG